MMLAVEVENLKYRYGKVEALKGICFDVKKGELFGLVGPNGGGKSTIFKILATLLPIQSGKVKLFGKPWNATSQVRCQLGIVFQSASLDEKLTVWENLRYQALLFGMRGKIVSKHLEKLLHTVGLVDRKHDLVGELSGGLQRRLDIAKALLHEPKVLILDEPTTGLDPIVRSDLWKYFNRLRADLGITILTTTHLLEEANQCDRIALLNQGRLVDLGTPENMKTTVGKEVISIAARDPKGLQEKIRAKFQLESQITQQGVRIEADSRELIVPLVGELSAEIESFSLSKPTLEDVFFKKTGQGLAQGAVL